MWDKSIPKRALKLAMYVSISISIAILLRMLFGPVVGTAYEIFQRAIIGANVVPICFWLFFTAYLFFSPNFDGYLDKHGGDDYGN